MSFTNLKVLAQFRHPIVIGTVLMTAYIAFANRHYILQDIAAEAEIMYKQDPEMVRLLEKAKEEMKR